MLPVINTHTWTRDLKATVVPFVGLLTKLLQNIIQKLLWFKTLLSFNWTSEGETLWPWTSHSYLSLCIMVILVIYLCRAVIKKRKLKNIKH